jgi:hypothetical protein
MWSSLQYPKLSYMALASFHYENSQHLLRRIETLGLNKLHSFISPTASIISYEHVIISFSLTTLSFSEKPYHLLDAFVV